MRYEYLVFERVESIIPNFYSHLFRQLLTSRYLTYQWMIESFPHRQYNAGIELSNRSEVAHTSYEWLHDCENAVLELWSVGINPLEWKDLSIIYVRNSKRAIAERMEVYPCVVSRPHGAWVLLDIHSTSVFTCRHWRINFMDLVCIYESHN